MLFIVGMLWTMVWENEDRWTRASVGADREAGLPIGRRIGLMEAIG